MSSPLLGIIRAILSPAFFWCVLLGCTEKSTSPSLSYPTQNNDLFIGLWISRPDTGLVIYWNEYVRDSVRYMSYTGYTFSKSNVCVLSHISSVPYYSNAIPFTIAPTFFSPWGSSRDSLFFLSSDTLSASFKYVIDTIGLERRLSLFTAVSDSASIVLFQ